MPPSPDKGSALLITLFFITIITLVAVGFMSSVRVERASSHSHFERMRAAEFARAGIEQTVATLRRETAYRFKAPDPDGVQRFYYRNYITQPGALIVPAAPAGTAADSATQARLTDVKLLSSGLPTVTQTNPSLQPPNLNIQTFDGGAQPTHLITDRQELDPLTNTQKTSEMKLKWIYVRQNRKGHADDPTAWERELDFSESPSLNDASKPIIGRYAYWADDESTKINYNLAWKRDSGGTTGTNTNRPCHPSKINLMALSLSDQTPLKEAMADMLHTWTTTTPGRYFNSFADARQVDPTISTFLDYNKFELTHYNHDPDTTFFGEDRILLTTNRDLVPKVIDPVTKQVKYTRKFLDIMRDDKPAASLDPGNLEDIAGGQQDWNADENGGKLVQGGVNKYDLAVRNLIRYISEKNWPLSPGVSFKDKYYKGSADTDARVAQIAVNIIDYVRAKESAKDLLPPVRFALDSAGKYSMLASVAYGANNSFQGVTRSPYVTEMGFYIEKNPTTIMVPSGTTYVAKPCYKCTFKMELHLPARYDLPDGIDLVPPGMRVTPLVAGVKNAYFLRFTATAQDSNHTFYFLSPVTNKMINVTTHPNYGVPILAPDVTGDFGTILKPGKYVTVTKIFYRVKAWSDPAAGKVALMRGAIHCATLGTDGFMTGSSNRWARLNVCPQFNAVTYNIADPDKSAPNNFPSIETDDPRANVSVNDWQPNVNAKTFLDNPSLIPNTFGKVNSVSTLGKKAPTAPASVDPIPQQDADDQGLLTDYSAYMPPPKGKGSNDSNGDNGLVTSIGELGYVNTGNDSKTKSVPWRTIRLQPNYYKDSTILPDWALMDLFGVPNSSAVTAGQTSFLYTPHNTSVGGRVNVNAHVEPFKNMIRDGALLASVLGTKTLKVPADASKVATNIYQRVLATGTNLGKSYGYPNKANPQPGDPNAYDTPGEVCEVKGVADTGEVSEDLVREVASLFTARGGVFSIYTIGQSLVQTPSGQLVVTGEQRQHAMVECYLENQGTLTTDDDEVRFRTVYFRNLNP